MMNRIFQEPKVSDVKTILDESRLPTDDLAQMNMEHFFGCGDRTRPQGVIGLERHGTDGLLRSLAVSSLARGAGCATALVEKLEEHSRAIGIENLYLLTETAEEFFKKKGYNTVTRDMASGSIRSTKQFSGLCPDSAVLMQKQLGR